MKLTNLTVEQLEDLYARIYNHIPYTPPCPGDITSGWDWPTLNMCYPVKYRMLKRVMAAGREVLKMKPGATATKGPVNEPMPSWGHR